MEWDLLWVRDSAGPDLAFPVFSLTWLITESLKEKSLETFEHGLGREGKEILRCDELLSVSDFECVARGARETQSWLYMGQ